MKINLRLASAAILLITLLCLCILPAAADNDTTVSGECGQDMTWRLDTATGELIISGEGTMDNYSTSRMAPWISRCGLITSVYIEEGVTSVGDYAFLYCNSLTSVSLPAGLSSIGEYAFCNCISMKEIELPASVSHLGVNTFTGCTTLETVVLPPQITSLPDAIFTGCSNLATVSIPATVTSIGKEAFLGCASLTDMDLPAGLTAVGNEAFSGCSSLNNVSFPVGVTSVGDKALASCEGLEIVTFPHTLTALGSDVLEGTSPHLVLFEGSAEQWDAVEVGESNAVLSDTLLVHPGHSFDRELVDPLYLVSPADCEHPALYLASCACGEAGEETFSDGDPLGHVGGEATCAELAVCEVCLQPWGELLPHTPDGVADCLRGVSCTVCGASLEDAKGHTYEDMVTAPTCTEAGYTAHVCADCQDTYTDTPVDATGHTPDEGPTCLDGQFCVVCGDKLADALGHDHVGEITLAPTCTEAGVQTFTCSRCQDAYDEPIRATGHTPGDKATCTEPRTCTVCNTVLTDKLGHDYRATTVEPTCDEQGYVSHVCARCSVSYRDTYTPAKGHTPGDEATCTEPRVCTVCNTILTDELGHDYRATTVEPTCDEQGYVSHVCARCSVSYRDTYTPAKGHTPGDEATCTEPRTCTVCNTVLTDKLGHDYRATTVEPTCDGQGYVSHVCARCSVSYRDTYTPAKGHTPGDKATCTEAQTCTACGTVLTDRLGHDYRATIIESTCDGQGYISHVCARCSASYRDTYTPAKGHTPGDEATCTEPRTCTVCRIVLTPATGHTFEETTVPPTCTEEGYTAHICASCQASYPDGITEPTGHTPGDEATCRAPQTCTVCHTVLTERLEHSYEESTVEATCTTDGRILRICSLCGDTFIQSVLPATGHIAGDWILDNQPDVGKPGRHHKSCEVCSEKLESETFWTVSDESTEPGETDHERVTVSGNDIGHEEGGCRLSAWNIVPILIILLAVFLLWFVDLRRR